MPWVTFEQPAGPQVIGDPLSVLQHQMCGFCQARYLRSIMQTECQLCAGQGKRRFIETCEKCDPDGELHDELVRQHFVQAHGQTEDTP